MPVGRTVLGGRTRLLAAACAVAIAAAAWQVGAPAARAVTGGGPDGSGHPMVATILDDNGSPRCTGVLVQASPDRKAVLTAAHCFARSGHPSGRTRVAFTAQWKAGAPTIAGVYFMDPAYDRHSSLADLAVVDLASDPGIEPATIAAVGAAASVTTVDVVGVGTPFVGQRRAATENVVSSDASWLYLVPGTGNTCGGDSGAPDFMAGSTVVVAVTDLGTCSTDQDTRVDTVEATQFVADAAGWAAEPPTVSAELSDHVVVAGQPVTLSGQTNKDFAGDRVLAQTASVRGWTTVDAATVARDGTYVFRMSPPAPGSYVHRIVVPSTAAHRAGASAASMLTVDAVEAGTPLENGDFESGSASPWRTTGSVWRSATSHSGDLSLRVGAPSPRLGNSTASQTFLASDAGLLTVNYRLVCTDTVRYDWTSVIVTDDTAGTVVTPLSESCANDRRWHVTQPAPLVAGHTYTVVLTTHDDGSRGDPTYALFDDIDVTATG